MNTLNINLKDKDLTVILTHDKFTVTKRKHEFWYSNEGKVLLSCPPALENFLSENNFMTDVSVGMIQYCECLHDKLFSISECFL